MLFHAILIPEYAESDFNFSAFSPPVIFQVVAHCQVPCGIFDDKRQLMKLKEDAATIKKARNKRAEGLEVALSPT